MNTIQLCADDFGQDPLINEAVFSLFYQQRLSATSVLIDGPHVASSVLTLQNAHKEGLEVGLHFNLTLAFPKATQQNIKPLYHWIVLSQLGLLNPIEIKQAFQLQLTRFEDTYGFMPDYIDGHQHVHQFPKIGKIVLDEVLKRYSSRSLPWIRNTLRPDNSSNIPQVSKAFVLEVLGGRSFYSLLKTYKLLSNFGFLGVYGFNAVNEAAYRELMRAWLMNAKSNTLIMCHPAIEVVNNDPIGSQRPIEFSYFSSDAFQEDLNLHHLTIAKMKTSVEQ
ncbi:ChbG/HpnK family deacetylase [Polynucleobacter rarus]|uniref:ChbG/HpnK family deacetylase n=1 Tax=Polynucleobacter rarus TaxID=556055 RepID=UPI000D3ED22F|nr:ChbG/HpnK family deacetylase [Polynucleobacter rarus]